MRMRIVRWQVIGMIVMPAGLLIFMVFGVQRVRRAAERSACEGRFCQMQFLLSMYHDHHGHFPPAYIVGPDGKPWHSWRVLILPYINHNDIYEQYRFDEPWNGPNNRLLADKINLKIFQCPGRADYGKTLHTNIVAIVGNETAFPGASSSKLSDFRDSGRHTILLAEYGNADIHWMEPRDLNADEMSFQFNDPASPSISSLHSTGPAVVFADGIKAYRLRRPLSAETLGELVKTKSQKHIRRDDLEHWNSRTGAYLSE